MMCICIPLDDMVQMGKSAGPQLEVPCISLLLLPQIPFLILVYKIVNKIKCNNQLRVNLTMING